jgi:hypothetical protein
MSDIIDLNDYRKKHQDLVRGVTSEIAADIESVLSASTYEVNERIKRIEATHFNGADPDCSSKEAMRQKLLSIRIDYSALVLDLFKKVITLERQMCFFRKGLFPPKK